MTGLTVRWGRLVSAIALVGLVGARPVPPILTVARLQYDGGGE